MPHQQPYANQQTMDFQNNEFYDRPHPQPPPPHQRRVLRQSTLPNNLPNPDHYYGQPNLMLPSSSPKQQISPQYSPYNTDTEDSTECSNPDLRPGPQSPRITIRRQSTLPCRPNDHNPHQQYVSTSPSRGYSRSPEKGDGLDQQQHQQRYPPFVRQSTFPSNSTDPYQNRPKILLPTSPNRTPYNRSPESSQHDLDFALQQQHRLMRQSTLPNPDQHIKLLPTSPPKRQTSPQYIKRSPEMQRQNTLPNPDAGMNSLSIHQQTPKFMPISPRQKQNFLFPQPNQHPRQFLSQQNVPNVADDPYSSTGSVSCNQREHPHAKMIKVRSHSNEEYTASRQQATEVSRRLLPEIPRNRSPR